MAEDTKPTFVNDGDTFEVANGSIRFRQIKNKETQETKFFIDGLKSGKNLMIANSKKSNQPYIMVVEPKTAAV